MENTTKTCTKCGRELPLSEFNKCKSKKDGLQLYCKECLKQWRAEHAEHKKQYNKQYRADNPNYMKQWRADNAKHIKQYSKEYYSTIEGYARNIRNNNLQADRRYGRCGKDEDLLPSIEYYIWALQQPDYYDGKQYHWSRMGLDRIYNDKPHTFANVVPCSTNNNNRRQKMPFDEFCELMKKENEELELIL